ncbi:MAG: glycosyltransferase family 4 protein [Chitinispirillaceae bacterium]|jgi:glycosyltransferase involved in cell wall biosynthesis|nr:glycosyltransferase family 4 protein [Chitinispirillaceae bacterium]
MKTISVALVTETYWPQSGGVESAVQQLAALLPTHVDCRIIAHGMSGATARQTERLPAVDPAGKAIITLMPDRFGKAALLGLRLWTAPLLRRIDAPRLFDKLFFFYALAYRRQLTELVKGSGIVHCFSTGYLARLTAEICRSRKIPFVQNPYIHFGRWGDSPRQLDAYLAAGAVICPTGFFRNRFCDMTGAPFDRVFVVPPVVADTVPAIDESAHIGDPSILFLGRREKHKGLPLLIEAFNALECPARLVIGGPGEPVAATDRIVDCGVIDDKTKQKLIDECDCLCVPSQDETFGIVYAEAMRSGKPVVALNVPPITEIIEHEVSGLLTTPYDAVALGSALTVMVTDHERRKRMGIAAKKRFDDMFAGKKSVEKIVKIYETLLSEP